ncbi:MAG: redoxin domain-containing protein [Planctomycetota bacterium]|jgi:thiol-disulfide isomerase/thioredoxin
MDDSPSVIREKLMMRSLGVLLFVSSLADLPAQEAESPRFELETLGGRKLSQEDFRNNVLLIDYWGTWCPPCRKAIPFLVDLYGKYKHHGLEIVGLTYERGAADPVQQVREYAAENRITYPLALGTPAHMRLVENFRGYPTMLFFGRGLKLEQQKVGFAESSKAEIEAWVRSALGLDGAEKEGGDSDPRGEGEKLPPEPDPEQVPEGKIFRPGEADRGFDFSAEDSEGKKIEFAELRGKPLVLALTSTWDREAVDTGRLLQGLQEEFGAAGIPILAACFEMSRDPEEKLQAIRKSREAQGFGYRMFAAGLDFQKKIHLFSGMPLFLVFDAEGLLVLREAGNAPATAEKIRARILAGG